VVYVEIKTTKAVVVSVNGYKVYLFVGRQ